MKRIARAALLSLAFMASYSCEKEVSPVPTLDIVPGKEVPAEGQVVSLDVKLNDGTAEGVSRTECTASETWISDFKFTAEKLNFTVAPYEAAREEQKARTATVTVTYPGIQPVEVKVTQAAPETLPGLSLELALKVEGVTVKVNCIPNYLEDTYVIGLVEKSVLDASGSEAEFIAADIENLKKEGNLADLLLKGKTEGKEFTIGFDKEYEVVAYGLSAEGKATTGLFSAAVSALAKPVITVTETPEKISCDGGIFTIRYSVSNAVAGQQLKAVSSEPWIAVNEVKTDAVTIKVSPFGEDHDVPARIGKVVLSYNGAEEVTVQVEQQPRLRPVITSTWDNATVIPADGGKYKLPFAIENAVAGRTLSATASESWISVSSVSEKDGIVSISVAANDAASGSSARKGSVTLKYSKAENLVLTFSQLSRQEPVLTINWNDKTELAAEGGRFEIPYELQNPVPGAELTLSSMYGYLKDLKAADGKITFTLTANPDTEVRKDYLFWEYSLGGNKFLEGNFVVRQAAKELPAVENMTFTFNVKSVGAGSVVFDCTPSNTSATYVLDVIEKSEYDATTDAELIRKNIATWTDPWNYDSILNHLTSGVKTDHKLSLSRQNTDYYIIAYGLNEDGTVTSKAISKVAIRSLGKPSISFAGGWDPWNTFPKKGGHYDVTVQITNPTDTDVLKAENKSPDFISNVTVKKVSQTEYTVSFDIAANNSGMTRYLKVRVTYGSVRKALLDDAAQSAYN